MCFFQEGSRELEAELEAQLEQAEGKIKEYRSLSNRLHMDNDELKAKLEQCHKEYAFQVGHRSYTMFCQAIASVVWIIKNIPTTYYSTTYKSNTISSSVALMLSNNLLFFGMSFFTFQDYQILNRESNCFKNGYLIYLFCVEFGIEFFN